MKFVFLSLIFIFCFTSFNQVVFYKKIGGKNYDALADILVTRSGDLLAVGRTDSYSQDMNINLIKFDTQGNIIWDRTYGGNETEGASAIIQTQEGGFLVAGYSDSNAENANENDVWLLKINANGEKEWERFYKTPDSIDEAQGLVETEEGNFLIVGNTTSLSAGNTDIFVMKVNKKGDILWQKKYGEIEGEQAGHIISTSQGFMIIGSKEIPKKRWDMWLLHIDKQGEILWNQNYGGSDNEMGNALAIMPDGSYVLAGFTYTYAEGSLDAWVVKINQKGEKIWDKTLGGLSTDEVFDVIITKEKNILIAGYTDMYVPDKNYNNTSNNGNDVLVALLDANGNELWKEIIGGLGTQRAYGIVEKDEAYFLAGYADENGNSGTDHLIIKINSNRDK
ncbi:hypothetical protein [Thermoflexibacter ruber]|nr:hypothetical protein [Thermoflexibacter ruber]